MQKVELQPFEVEELACAILGIDYDEIDADSVIIETALYQKYGMTMIQFLELISILLPMIDTGKNPINKKSYKGFANTEKGLWFVKTPIEN